MLLRASLICRKIELLKSELVKLWKGPSTHPHIMDLPTHLGGGIHNGIQLKTSQVVFKERRFILSKILNAFSLFSLEQDEDRAVAMKHYSSVLGHSKMNLPNTAKFQEKKKKKAFSSSPQKP